MRLLNSAPAAVPIIANFLLFQTVWLVTVIAASRDLTWPGVAALCFFLLAHAALSASARGDYRALRGAGGQSVIVVEANKRRDPD